MEKNPLRTELILPNDPGVLPLARNYVGELAIMAQLPQEQGEALVKATVEACANVIDHAFLPGETGTFTVCGEMTPTELAVSVRDQGMPFAASLTPDAALPADDIPARISASGGLAMIREAVDKADWINHGKAGKELRLVTYRPDRDVTEQLSEAELSRFREDEPRAPEQEYTIRRFRPEDALGVARCIYRTYGYTYLHEDCYHPERLARHNETGEIVSVVAVDASGEVVGHYALERPQLTPVAERGMAVVAPAHRGRDLLQRMRAFTEEEAKRLGLVGTYSQAVTHHIYSQRVNEEFSANVCALTLGGSPRSLVFKKMKFDAQAQRISWVIYFDYIGTPPTAVAYAPAHHRAMLERIYGEIHAPVEFREPEPVPADEMGEVAVSVNPGWQSAVIRVLRVGTDTPAEIRRARRDLCGINGAEAVYLELPLSQPGTPELCRIAEEAGFFFCGLGPSFAPDGDTLRMQYLNVPLDTSLVKLASPFAQELLGYIDQERARGSGVKRLVAITAASRLHPQ